MRNRNSNRNWRTEQDRAEQNRAERERYTPAYSEYENEYSNEPYNQSEYNERESRPRYEGGRNYPERESYGRYGESTRGYRGSYEGGQRQSPYGAGYQGSESYEGERGYGSTEDIGYGRESSGRSRYGREEEFGTENLYERRGYEPEEREYRRSEGFRTPSEQTGYTGRYTSGHEWRSERERQEAPRTRRTYGEETYSATTGRGRNRERSWEKEGRVGARRPRQYQY